MPTLKVQEPGKTPYTLPISDVVKIGTAGSNHLVLAGPDIDTHHCAIEKRKDGFVVIDFDSPAGTRVNGQAVHKARLLDDRDEILIGQTRIVFDLRGDGASVEAPRRVIIRRRRHSGLRRRRIVLPKRATGQKQFSFDDLKVVFDSIIEEQGEPALDKVAEILDEYYEELRGTKLLAYLRSELDALYRLLEINRHLTSEHDPDQLLELILDGMIEITGAERGFIILKEGDALNARAARNMDREEIKKPEFKVSRTIVTRVMESAAPLVSVDAQADAELGASESVEALQIRSVACVPLNVARLGTMKPIGCVYIDHRFEPGLFADADIPLFTAFAEQASIALETARLVSDNASKAKELARRQAEVERLNEQLKGRVEAQYEELRKVRGELIVTTPSKYEYREIIGRSPAMREVLHLLDRVIESDENVFVFGDSGTGKELVARAIHHHGRRKAGPFVGENCSAIPETLLESELFGHERGSFTGAVAQKKGLFELASGGTLFLDEIGDMPLEMQKKLLRAIQEGEVRRVGGKDAFRVDVRIISASNKDLKALIKTGEFREDLFYRLNVVQINLPPLRDRREDIPLLVDHFLQRIAAEKKGPPRKIADAALWALKHHAWPGNVRELENEIRRAVALSDDTITLDVLKEEIRATSIVMPAAPIGEASPLRSIVERAVEDVERRVILQVLDDCGWKKIEAARFLGISRPTLDAKIEKYGLEKKTEGK